jgi:hypothetical protein
VTCRNVECGADVVTHVDVFMTLCLGGFLIVLMTTGADVMITSATYGTDVLVCWYCIKGWVY